MPITSAQKSYLAGFLDGDGSIYVRLKPNKSYQYGFQVSPYVIFFQSSKNRKSFESLCSLVGFGYMRERKDGILEFTVGRKNDIKQFLSMVKPYVILKKKQVDLMEVILERKEKVNNKNDFVKLMNLIDSFRELNYSKKRIKHTLTP